MTALSKKEINHIGRLEKRLSRGGWKGSKVLGAPQISAKGLYICNSFPKISKTLTRWSEGAQYVKSGPDKGRVIIQNMNHERDLCTRHGFANKFDKPPE